jgi:hypothetical protein
VLAWQPGQPPARQARVQAMTATGFRGAGRSLLARRIVSASERRGASLRSCCPRSVGQGRAADAGVKAGLQKRGITDLTKVFCAPFSAYYGTAGGGKRPVKVGCFTRRSTTRVPGGRSATLRAGRLRKTEVLSVTITASAIADGDFNYDTATVKTTRERGGRLRPRNAGTMCAPTATRCPGQLALTCRPTRASATILRTRWRDGQACVRCCTRLSLGNVRSVWTPTTAGSHVPTSTPESTAPASWPPR